MPRYQREVSDRRDKESRERTRTRRRSAILTLVLVSGALALATLAASDLPRLGRLVARAELARSDAEFLGSDGIVFQSALNDCGPAALANLMRIVGVAAPSTDSLMVLADTKPRGTTAGGLIRAASRFNLSLMLTRLTPAELPHTRFPFIAWVNRNHFVTVTGRSPSGRLTVVDPTVGRYSISEEGFKKIWSGESILLAG